MGFVLVTGTGSGVGKTWVTRGLARTLQQRGLRVLAVKPVEVGCDLSGEEGEDGALLARTTGQTAPRSALVRFGPPLDFGPGTPTETVTATIAAALHAL